MESLSVPILIVLAMVAFANYTNGTLPQWLRAKLFNSAAPRRAASSSSDRTSPPLSSGPTDAVLTGLGGGDGVLRRPVDGGTITGRFGDNRGDHRHQGLDFAVPSGTPVRAARGGRVVLAGPSGTYGLRVDLDHGGGVTTRYAHLSAIKVKTGESVPAGHVIALSGNTGRSSGPHLHFELRQNGVARDPAPALAGTGTFGGGAVKVA